MPVVQCPACGDDVRITPSGRISSHRPAKKPEHWTDGMFHWNRCAGRSAVLIVKRCGKRHHRGEAPCKKILSVKFDANALAYLGTYLLPSLRP